MNNPTQFQAFVTRDAEAKTSKAGKNYVLINCGIKNKDDGTVKYVRVLSFDRGAKAEDYAKGATIRVTGNLKEETYTDRDGNERKSWSCLASKTLVAEKPKTKQTAWWDDNNE
jgi:single-stranded DNA-binding protein